MSANETVAVNFQAVGADKFAQDVSKAEIELRRQARTLDDHARTLQQELAQLKATEAPNQQRIRTLQAQINQDKLAASSIRSRIQAMKDESKETLTAIKAQEDLVKAQEKANAKQATEEARAYAQALKTQADAAKAAAKEQENLAKAAAKALQKTQTAEAKATAKALKEEADAAKAAAKEQENLAKAAAKEAQKKAAAEAKLLAQAEKEAEQQVNGLTKSLVGQATTLLGTAVTLAAFLTSLSTAITDFGKFERTLNTIEAVSQATGQEMEAIKQSSLDLGAKTVFSNQQVADSYLALSKAGLTVQEQLSAMPGVLDAAAASGDDLASTAEIVIGTLRGFNLQASESTRVADVLAQAANSSAADISDIGTAMKQIAPTASLASQSLEDMAAVTAALADHMIKGGDAGSDLKAILLRLINPPAEAAKAIKTLGLSVTDAQGRVKPLIDIVLQLQTKLKSFNQKGQISLLGDIAGLENVKSLSTLVGIGADKLKSYQAAMLDADGAAQRMADTINKGLNTAFEQFLGSLETAATKFGEKLAPSIELVINNLTQLTNAISANDKFQSITIGAVGATVAFGGLLTALLAIPPALEAITTTAGIAATALGVSTGGLSYILLGLVAVGGALGAMFNESAERAKFLAQTSLDLSKAADQVTNSVISENTEALKLAKQYDELSKKKSLTKDETQRLIGITDSLITKFGLEGISIDELTKKYGSLTEAIKEKIILDASSKRQDAIHAQLEQTQAARKAATYKVREANVPFTAVAGITGGATVSNREVDQKAANLAKAELDRLTRQEEFLKDSEKSALADTRKLFEASLNPKKPSNSTTPTGSQTYSGSNKKKKGVSQATLDRRQVTSVTQNLSDFNSALDARYSLSVANLGAFPTQAQLFGQESKKLKEQLDELTATWAKLNALDPKTQAGMDAKTEALKKVTTETKKNEAATQELQNRVEQFNKEQQDRRDAFVRNSQNNAMDFEYNQLKDHIDQIQKDQEQLYQNGAISAEQYYSTLLENSNYLYRIEQDHLQQRIADNQKQMDSLSEQEIEQGKQIDLAAQRLQLENQLADSQRKQVDAQADLTRQYNQANQAFANNLKSQTEQALQQAISDAFTGNGITATLKQFGKAFQQVLSNGLGQILSKAVGNSLSNGGFFSKLFNGVNVTGGAVNGSSLAALATSPAVVALLGAAIAQKGVSVASNAKGTGGQAVGTGLGAAGGALAGAAIGSLFGPVGTVVGGIAGAAIGGGTAVAKTQRTGAIGRNKDAIVGALLGGVTGAVIGHIMDNKANKLADWQRNSDKNQTLANAVLNSADQNNLVDLNNQIKYLQGLWSKQQKAHKGGKQPLKDAIAQLQQLVKQRQAVIDQEVASLKDEASGLQNQVDTFGKSDVEAAAENYKYDLQQLQSDTQKLLDQFKDSEEAKTQILANESLKRQLIEKQTQDTYKQSLQDLNDLFKQRDEISNQDVFTRAQTTSQKKAQDLASIDQQIAQALSSVSDLSQLGFTVPDVSGATQLLSAAQQATQQNNTLTFLINGAQDPNAIAAAINQQITAFFKKNFGATT